MCLLGYPAGVEHMYVQKVGPPVSPATGPYRSAFVVWAMQRQILTGLHLLTTRSSLRRPSQIVVPHP